MKKIMKKIAKKLVVCFSFAAMLCVMFCGCKKDLNNCTHEFGNWIEKVDATCVDEGVLPHKKCLLCGKNFDEHNNEIISLVIDAYGHEFGDWCTEIKPTAEKEGLATRICEICDEKEEKVLPILIEKSFSISYDLNSGVLYSKNENPTQYKNTDDDISILNPYKEGCVFVGWQKANEKPIKNYKIKSGSEENLILVAVYDEDKTKIYGGSSVDVTPDAVRKYLDADNKAEYLYKYNQNYVDADNPSPVVLEWTNVYGSTSFDIIIACDNEYEDVVYEGTVTDKKVSIYNLIPKKSYYYKVTDNNANVIKIDSFIIEESLRMIYCGSIKNVRDEGGKNTPNGITQYGLVYRAPEIAGNDSKAKDILVNKLGIKTEIDLRYNSTTETIDASITKYCLGILQWDCLFPEMNSQYEYKSTHTDNLKKIFQIFANKDNYPIVFHCTLGADRTGTVGFLLNALLGVSYEDLAVDFEITSFYYGARWRSNIENSNGTYCFDDSGAMQSETNLIAFDRTYRWIMEKYKTESGTLSDAVANYLKTVVGLSDNELNSIISIMLGKDEYESSTQSVAQPLLKICNLNKTSAKCNYQKILEMSKLYYTNKASKLLNVGKGMIKKLFLIEK